MTSAKKSFDTEEPPTDYPWADVSRIVADALTTLVESADDGAAYTVSQRFSTLDTVAFAQTCWVKREQTWGYVEINVVFARGKRDFYQPQAYCIAPDRLVAWCDAYLCTNTGFSVLYMENVEPEGVDRSAWVIEQAHEIKSFLISHADYIRQLTVNVYEQFCVEEDWITKRTFDTSKDPVVADVTLTTRDPAVATLIGLQYMMYSLLRLVGDQLVHVNVASLFETWVRDFHPALPSESVTVDLSRRAWKWLAAEVTGPNTIRLLLSFHEWPAPWDDLEELLTIANVTQIDFLPPGHRDNPWGQHSASVEEAQK